MRNLEDIRRAHDVLSGILAGDIELRLPEEVIKKLHIVYHVLCWILEVKGTDGFNRMLRLLYEAMAEAGYIEERIQ